MGIAKDKMLKKGGVAEKPFISTIKLMSNALICGSTKTVPTYYLREALKMQERIKELIEDHSGPTGRREEVRVLTLESSKALHNQLDAFDNLVKKKLICYERPESKLFRATLALITLRSDEACKHVSERSTFRKIKRLRYDQRYIIRGLISETRPYNNNEPLLTGLDMITVLWDLYSDLKMQSMRKGLNDVDAQFAIYGAEIIDLAYAQSLSAVIAYNRGMEHWQWSQYKIGIHDKKILTQLGEDPKLRHRHGHMSAAWLGSDNDTRRFALESLNWLDASSAAGEIAISLVNEWDGELSDLVESAKTL